MYVRGESKKNAHLDGIWCAAWGQTGLLVTGGADETLKVWNPSKMDTPHSFQPQGLAISSVDVSPEGTTAVSASMDGWLRVYDIVNGVERKKFDSGPKGAWAVAFHPSAGASSFVVGTKTGSATMFDIAGQVRHEYETKDGKFCMTVGFSRDGSRFALGDHSGAVFVFDAKTGQVVHTITCHAKPVRSLTFSRDGKQLICGSDDNYISITDVEGNQQVAYFSAHSSWVVSLAMSPVVDQFASASVDKKVKLWDLRQRESLHSFDSHTDQAWAVRYNVDGTKLVSVGDDATINFYDIRSK